MDFEEVLKNDNRSSIWYYFLRSKCKKQAKCKICYKVLKCSRTGLQKHLRSLHRIIISNCASTSNNIPSTSTSSISLNEEDTGIPKKKTKITDYFDAGPKPTTRLSRMVALDGIPFRTFSTSEDLRWLFQNSGYCLPNSPSSIRKIVLNETTKIKKTLIEEIKKILSDGQKFSISFDECSSNRNRRYVSLNLHSELLTNNFKFRNLGLLRIHGSMTVETVIEELTNIFQSYGLEIEEDIVAATTDGCSSMITKVGQLLNSYHQKCIAHTVQLAVVDVFYNENKVPITQNIEGKDEDKPVANLALLHENEDNNNENSDDEDDGVVFEIERASPQNEFRYHDILAKVRKTVKIFKEAPEFGEEYQMILDDQTEWISIANMLSRFLTRRNCITKALIDLKVDTVFTEEEWALLQELHDVLDTVKTTVAALCQQKATLLTADVDIKNSLEKLSTMNSNLSKEMYAAITKRYIEIRLPEASVMEYLDDADTYFFNMTNEELNLFRRPDANEIHEIVLALLQRTSSENTTTKKTNTLLMQSKAQAHEIQYKKDEHHKEIQKALAGPSPEPSTTNINHDLSTLIRLEMDKWKNIEERGEYLSLAYKHLSTIPPTIVEMERIFSSRGYIRNRVRTRLSDQSLDAIWFLRNHYHINK